jgi:hypothetical protein
MSAGGTRFLLIAALGSLLAGTPVVAEEPLGRLFFSAERRTALDRARQFNIEEQQVAQQTIVTVEGVVARSSGRTTAWVNGVAVPEGGLVNLKATPTPNRSAVRVQPSNEVATTIVVGTALNRTTGERVDPLGGGFVSRDGPVRMR